MIGGDRVGGLVGAAPQRGEVVAVQREALLELLAHARVDAHLVRLAQRALAEQQRAEQRHERHGRDREQDLAFEATEPHHGTLRLVERKVSVCSAEPRRRLTKMLTNEPKNASPRSCPPLLRDSQRRMRCTVSGESGLSSMIAAK